MMGFLRLFNFLGWIMFAVFAIVVAAYLISPRQTKTEIVKGIEHLPDGPAR